MNGSPSSDPRFESALSTDQAMLSAHEAAFGPQPDDRANYRLLPLCVLFAMSGFILFAATYLNRYSGHFDPTIFNENLVPSKGATVVAINPVEAGQRLFMSGGACVTCHQQTGQGLPGIYPPLAGSEWVNGTEDRMIRIVLTGLKGPITVENKTFGQSVMPSFGPHGFNWNDDKISEVITYVRQAWGNHGGAVTADKVAAIRAQIGDHAEWSEQELLQVK